MVNLCVLHFTRPYVDILTLSTFLLNRGARGVSVQPLHLRDTQLPHAPGGARGTPHQTDPHAAGARRPGAESPSHHRARGARGHVKPSPANNHITVRPYRVFSVLRCRGR